jgi:O-antigen biosynthesis protein
MPLNLLRRVAGRLRRVLPFRRKPVAPPSAKALGLRGSLSGTTQGHLLSGWAAKIGDAAPRKVEIRGPKGKLTVIADKFRHDLLEAGINDGQHSFRIELPLAWASRSPVRISLVDQQTGVVLESKYVKLNFLERSYDDFDGFLQSSMTQPLISVPLTPSDRRAFAVMENIANMLVREAAALEEPPLVTVIMPVYNRAEIVGKAIASVLAQSYANLELIVVDDASTDATVETLRTISDPRLHLITSAQNRGAGASRTEGLAKAKGSLIAYLDSDNEWDDRYLAAMVGAMARLPDADAAYSGMFLYRGKSEKLSGVRYAHFNPSLLEVRNYMDLNCLVHRRSLVEKAGYLDLNLRHLVDYDFFLRAAHHARIYSIPVVLAHYHYDRAEATITKNTDYPARVRTVRERQKLALSGRTAQARDVLQGDVAVVIASWQALEDLTACIDSLLYQDWNGRLHVIVVDNASDDDVVSYLRAKEAEGKITLICNRKNYGFSYAINQGIAVAPPQADILIANNDTVFQRGAIQALRDALHALPDAGITAPRQMLRAATKTITTHVPYASMSAGGVDVDVQLSAHHRNIGPVPLFQGPGPVELTFAIFFCVLIKRDVIDALGPLDAEYGRHYRSDQTYCAMVRSVLGRKIYYVPDAVAYHGLQKSTEALRSQPVEFDLMYNKNQWDAETRAELGYRLAPWDETPT